MFVLSKANLSVFTLFISLFEQIQLSVSAARNARYWNYVTEKIYGKFEAVIPLAPAPPSSFVNYYNLGCLAMKRREDWN